MNTDTSDLARKFGVTERTVRKRARDGKIPGKIQDDTRHLFDKKIIDEWLKSDKGSICPVRSF